MSALIPGPIGQPAQGGQRPAPAAVALAGNPLLELRCGIGDEQAIEELTAEESARLLVVTGVDRRGKRHRITPDHVCRDSDLFFAAHAYGSVAQLPAQDPKRLPQRGTGVLRVGFGPEERGNRIATAEASGSGKSEIDEEREAFGLGAERAHVAAVGFPQVDGAEGAKFIRVSA